MDPKNSRSKTKTETKYSEKSKPPRSRSKRFTHLIGEPNTETKQDTADDQHGDVFGGRIDNSSGEEQQTTEQHGQLPAQSTCHGGRHQRRQESRQVQRRREQGQRLTVVLAVLVGRRLVFFLPVHRVEELHQK